MEEAETAEAHLHHSGNSPQMVAARAKTLEIKTHIASRLIGPLFKEANSKSGKEKFDLLCYTSKYTRFLLDRSKSKDVWKLRSNHRAVLDEASTAADDFIISQASKLAKSELEETSNFSSGSELLSEDSVQKKAFPDMDEMHRIHKELYEYCKDVLNKFRESQSESSKRKFSASKKAASNKMAKLALTRHFQECYFIMTHLSHLTTPSEISDAALFTSLSAAHLLSLQGHIALRVGSLTAAMMPQHPLPHQQRCEMLRSSIVLYEDIVGQIEWIAELGEQHQISAEDLAQFKKITESAARLKDFMEFMLKELEAEEEPVEESQVKSTHILIETKFDDKQFAIPKGDLMVVKDFTGREIPYQQDDAGKWVKCEEDDDFDKTSIEDESDVDETRDKADKTLLKELARSDKKTEALQKEAARYATLSSFVEKKHVNLSSVASAKSKNTARAAREAIGIFRLALKHQQSAITRFKQTISRLGSEGDLSHGDPELVAEHLEQVQALLRNAEKKMHDMKQGKLDYIRENPTEAGLNFLLDEGHITIAARPATTATYDARKQMSELTIKGKHVQQEDFMDEDLLVTTLEGMPPYRVRSHYQKRSDPVEACTKRYLIWEVKGQRVNIPISQQLLQRIVALRGGASQA